MQRIKQTILTLLTLINLQHAHSVSAQEYDLVILNGKVMDPESQLEAVRNIGITNGAIQAISIDALRGRTTIDAKGLIVAPGFIDLHMHDMNDEHHRAQIMDGVTTALDLEIGTADIEQWYAER